MLERPFPGRTLFFWGEKIFKLTNNTAPCSYYVLLQSVHLHVLYLWVIRENASNFWNTWFTCKMTQGERKHWKLHILCQGCLQWLTGVTNCGKWTKNQKLGGRTQLLMQLHVSIHEMVFQSNRQKYSVNGTCRACKWTWVHTINCTVKRTTIKIYHWMQWYMFVSGQLLWKDLNWTIPPLKT